MSSRTERQWSVLSGGFRRDRMYQNRAVTWSVVARLCPSRPFVGYRDSGSPPIDVAAQDYCLLRVLIEHSVSHVLRVQIPEHPHGAGDSGGVYISRTLPLIFHIHANVSCNCSVLNIRRQQGLGISLKTKHMAYDLRRWVSLSGLF